MKFFYTDGRTGRFSSTTLRTWLLFTLFFVYATALAVGSFCGLEISQNQLDLLGLLGIVFGAGGMLYMGKRFTDPRFRPPEKESIQSRQL